jgi:hypothetical protein
MPLPTPTPHYTAEGNFQTVTRESARFELLADWHVTYDWIASFAQKLDPSAPFTAAEWARGPMKMDYRELNYREYTQYTFEGDYESIMVAGYPALLYANYSEPFSVWTFALIVEGPDTVYAFSMFHSVNPEVAASSQEEAYERGMVVIQHIVDTLEILRPALAESPIGSHVTVTGTIALVELEHPNAASDIVQIEPFPDHPYSEAVFWDTVYESTYITYPRIGDILVRQLRPGDVLRIVGRPTSGTRLLADSVLVVDRLVEDDPFAGEVILTGQVTTVDREHTVIELTTDDGNAQTVQLFDDTYIMFADETPAAFADIGPGIMVQVYIPADTESGEATHITIFGRGQ